MPQPHLLPSNATAFEIAVAQASDPVERLAVHVNNSKSIRFKRPVNQAFKKAILYEWGLNEILPWVSEDVALDEGVDFYRKRGTPSAVNKALQLVGYGSTKIEEAPTRRRLWNKFQIETNRVRDSEVPDLDRIHGITQFSVAERSRFTRAYKGYDVRGLETSWGKTSNTLLSDDSGARIATNPVKWSFERRYDADITLDQAALTSLGVWIAPSANPFTWAQMNFPWALAGFTWNTTVNVVRLGLMAAMLQQMSCWVEFRRANGSVIGFRRSKAKHQIIPNIDGFYSVNGTKFTVGAVTDTLLYVEALTEFGDFDGETAAVAALRFGATPADTTKPGLLVAGPTELTLPLPAVALRNVNIPFGKTVRERVVTLLRFT